MDKKARLLEHGFVSGDTHPHITTATNISLLIRSLAHALSLGDLTSACMIMERNMEASKMLASTNCWIQAYTGGLCATQHTRDVHSNTETKQNSLDTIYKLTFSGLHILTDKAC